MEEFEIWKKIFNEFLKDELYRLREIVSPLNLSIKIVADYQFRSRWYAAYLNSRGAIQNGVIEVAINYPLLFKAMKRRGIAQDEFNIEAQARITLGHEVAHGIIGYLRILNPTNLSKSLRILRRCGKKIEEEYAEEFGESRFPEATGIFSSVIERGIDEISEKHIPLNESHAVRMWHYTTFENAIEIIATNMFLLQQNDDTEDDAKILKGKEWFSGDNKTTPPKYMLCTTRIRDCKAGYSSMFLRDFLSKGEGFCRIEINEDAVNISNKMIVRSQPDVVNIGATADYNPKNWNYEDKYGYVTPNWENQHEERILSNKPYLLAYPLIRRMDFLLKDTESVKELKEWLNWRREFVGKVFIYTNVNDFNFQSKNTALLKESGNDEITYEISNDCIQMYLNGDNIGGIQFNPSDIEDIYSEYSDSVEDFDDSILRQFSSDISIVNIEDVWVNKSFQGKGLFRRIFQIGMDILSKRFQQFILRASSDNGFPEDKLVDIYREFGFIPYQETYNDGTIMFKT